MTTYFEILYEDVSKRLDFFVSERAGTTRSQAQKLIKDGSVLVNGNTESPNYRTKLSDTIEVNRPEEGTEGLVPENIPLNILHMDGHVVVVDKPAGMVVYPAAGHGSGTLMNALAYHCDKLASVGAPLRPGVVHRLDKDTSGVMVVALSDDVYYNLVGQFRERTINRVYKALVFGDFKGDSGVIEKSIGRSDSDRKRMSTRGRRGKPAFTTWRVIKRFGHATLIAAKLGTGRTHQIRVHFAAIGHPVLGDDTYGRKTSLQIGKSRIDFPRQMLHAETLGFTHPATGDYLEFEAGMPDDMTLCAERLACIA
ncbi:MAG: RluA family pseudouridine synthase [Nitrospirae bacterium]|nr:MAG: RluA family pseudouridine synthase [Nitrospirota bacterium]